MKKIINPWKGLEGYNCFGCASNNEAGDCRTGNIYICIKLE